MDLSWIITATKENSNDVIKNSIWADVKDGLIGLSRESGSITIELLSNSGSEKRVLQVISDRGNYLITLGEDDGYNYNVRSYLGSKKSRANVEVSGYLYDAALICNDFNVVVDIFKQFLENGDVSRALLR